METNFIEDYNLRVFDFNDRHSWPNEIGIYSVNCSDNNFNLVGQTGCQKGFFGRWSGYYSQLLRGSLCNRRLQDYFSINYNKKNFKFIILENCEIKDLNTRERYWSIKLKSYNKNYGWNKMPTGLSKQFHENNPVEKNESDFHISCGISKEQNDKIEEFCNKRGCSRGEFNRNAIECYVDKVTTEELHLER